MFEFLTLAQGNQDPEITIGGLLASTLLLGAVSGSLVVMSIWVLRYRDGRPVLPVASRKPLIVPLPLLVIGVLLGLMMSLSAAVSSQLDNQSSPAEAAAPEDNHEPGPDAERPAPLSNADRSRFMTLILGTLSFNLMMLTAFGIVIVLCQANYSRRVTDPQSVSYGNPHNDPDAFAATDQVASSIPGAAIADTGHLFEASPPPLSPYAPPNPFLDGPLENNPEAWRLGKELRFAVEAVLAAYLPTAAIRLLILSLQPEAPSHPFFKVIQSGVDWTLLTMIGLMAVIVAPVVEEMLYRVTILGGLMQQRAGMLGLCVSSVLFAFAHGFPDSIALLPLSLAIGYTYMCRRSYRTVILIHLLFNTFNMTMALLALM